MKRYIARLITALFIITFAMISTGVAYAAGTPTKIEFGENTTDQIGIYESASYEFTAIETGAMNIVFEVADVSYERSYVGIRLLDENGGLIKGAVEFERLSEMKVLKRITCMVEKGKTYCLEFTAYFQWMGSVHYYMEMLPTVVDGFALDKDDKAIAYLGDAVDVVIPARVKELGNLLFENRVESVTVPATISEIPGGVFGGGSTLKKIVIEGDVTRIENESFMNCYGLETVVLPDSVKSIGDKAFAECDALTSITLPKNLESIGDGAFSKCDKLQSVVLPESMAQIGARAFEEDAKLTDINLPDNIYSIGEYAFYKCTALKSITLPSRLTRIEDYLFWGDKALASIAIPDSISYIGESAFGSCAIESIDLPENVAYIGGWAFSGCAHLKEITIPEKVVKIAPYTFHWCDELVKVVLPAGIGAIGEYAFDSCTLLSDIELPARVTEIGAKAFLKCENLKKIDVSRNLEKVGAGAFDQCYQLKKVVFRGTEADYRAVSIDSDNAYFKSADFSFIDYDHIHQYKLTDKVLPTSSATGLNTYTCACGEVRTETVPALPGDIFVVDAGGVLKKYNGLDYIVEIPNTVKSIDAYAFDTSDAVVVLVPASVSRIEMYAFAASDVEMLYLPKTVTNIGEKALGDKLKDIYYEGNEDEWNAITIADTINSRVTIHFDNKHVHTFTEDVCEEATCEDEGYIRYSCSCGTEFVKTTPRLDHRIVVTDYIEATCQYKGTTVGVYCEMCGKVFAEPSEIPVKQHLVVNLPGKEAKCQENGYTDSSYCASCQTVFKPQTVIEYPGHKVVSDPAVQAAYGKEGSVGGSHCSVCGQVFNKPQVVPALPAFEIDESGKLIRYNANEEHVVLPASVKVIGEKAFYKNQSIKTVTILDGTTSIGWDAFAFCYNLEAVHLPDTLLSVGTGAFEGCGKLDGVIIPGGASSIGDMAFRYCVGLKEITIPSTVTRIGKNAFFECDNLATIKYSGSKKNWNSITIAAGNDALSKADLQCAIVEQEGWVMQDGSWYYYISGQKATGWKLISGTYYYMRSNGVMATGWLLDGGKWYYLKSSGAMATGWVLDAGKWYYMDSSGAMLSNTTRTISGKSYTFNSSGACVNPY